jgi:hypothetical protein
MPHWRAVVCWKAPKHECSVTFPAITEAELFWAIAGKVVRRQPGGGASGPDHLKPATFMIP